jgi:uncharacterized tellurite resistance protein B-like protein
LIISETAPFFAVSFFSASLIKNTMSDNMTPLQSLHFAIGELAYAIARADGKVQQEERQAFHNIVSEELKKNNYAFDISSIIFQIMDRDKAKLPDSYHFALKQIKLNSHYLSPQLKKTFARVIEKVAAAYPPVTAAERELINQFEKDIEPLMGDPVYYNSNK